MAKKVKDNTAGVLSEPKTERKAGKDIVPRLKVIDKQSFIMMASSRGKQLITALLWAPAPKNPEQPYLFLFDLPDGDGGTMLISVPMAQKQAQAVYAGHPRRVPKSDMPPECQLEEVIEAPKTPKTPKAPSTPEVPPTE